MSAPILDLFRLDGKLAVVTGCKRGIGRAFALALAEAGADIAGVSRTLEPGSELEGEVVARGRKFKAIAAISRAGKICARSPHSCSRISRL